MTAASIVLLIQCSRTIYLTFWRRHIQIQSFKSNIRILIQISLECTFINKSELALAMAWRWMTPCPYLKQWWRSPLTLTCSTRPDELIQLCSTLQQPRSVYKMCNNWWVILRHTLMFQQYIVTDIEYFINTLCVSLCVVMYGTISHHL